MYRANDKFRVRVCRIRFTAEEAYSSLSENVPIQAPRVVADFATGAFLTSKPFLEN
jgi:hypothetical protein